jgi:hypothetical protein
MKLGLRFLIYPSLHTELYVGRYYLKIQKSDFDRNRLLIELAL